MDQLVKIYPKMCSPSSTGSTFSPHKGRDGLGYHGQSGAEHADQGHPDPKTNAQDHGVFTPLLFAVALPEIAACQQRTDDLGDQSMGNAVDALDIAPDQKNGHAESRQGKIGHQPEGGANDDDLPFFAAQRMADILVNQAIAIVIYEIF